jgi:L-seryl-tRNA(Ser) seleniumtransferase
LPKRLPAVNALLEHPSVAPYESLVGRAALREAVNAELDRARTEPTQEPLELLATRVTERLDTTISRSLLKVINGTGTLLHTNLGRAPIAKEAFEDAWTFSSGYSNLEYDVIEGERGSRYERASGLLRELTGAEDGIVVNNCAAAVLLMLDTFAKGREVIVARNQLIEIGGGFRLPDVLARSSAQLVEVGATNKVYLHDYEAALSPRTALLMRSHRSNFSIEGFVHDAAPAELVTLGARAGVPVIEDLGSGALVDLAEYGLAHERTIQEAVHDGVGLIAFSGDKLLGGPQAGIIVGKRVLVARLRSNPLIRALRVDKVAFGLLTGTLKLHRSRETREYIPLYRMLSYTVEQLRERAARYEASVDGTRAVESEAFIGGGSLPHVLIPSIAVAFQTSYPDELASRLRRGSTPIVARVESDAILLDLRTIAPSEDSAVISVVRGIQVE